MCNIIRTITISLDFSTGLRTWQERDGYSTLIRYGEPGHPWGDRDIIEGRNEIVCFEDTFYRTQLQYNRYATEGAVLILGNIALPKPLTWLVTALDTLLFGADVSGKVFDETPDGIPHVEPGNIADWLQRNPQHYQSNPRFGPF